MRASNYVASSPGPNLEQANDCTSLQFVQVSGDPRTALNNLQRIVPPAIFNLVVQGFAAMAEAKVIAAAIIVLYCMLLSVMLNSANGEIVQFLQLQQNQQQKQKNVEASELD